MPISVGDLSIRLIRRSIGPHESAANGISIGSVVFAQLARVPNTQTRTETTLRATCVGKGGIYAVRTVQQSAHGMLPFFEVVIVFRVA